MHDEDERQAPNGFMASMTGKLSFAWNQYSGLYGGWGGPGYGYGGNPGFSLAGIRYGREGLIARDISAEMALSNPNIWICIQVILANCLGSGLALCSRPDYKRLGITLDQSRALAHEFESFFRWWSDTPLECDLAGETTLNGLIAAAFVGFLLSGEVVALMDIAKVPGAKTRTKLNVLDSKQLAADKNEPGSTRGIYNGIQFSETGRIEGYWIRKFNPGAILNAPMPEFIASRTPWGRPRVIFLKEKTAPGQVRGLSPLVSALSPSLERRLLSESTLAAAYIQTIWAATVKSAAPAATSLEKLSSPEFQRSLLESNSLDKWAAAHNEFYEHNKIKLGMGSINHMMPGDSLELNRSNTPNSNFEAYDKSLARMIARAAGLSYEDFSGDFKDTSYSASKLSAALPFKINMRRRDLILKRMYKAVYECVIEEAVETGMIKLPKGAPAFWMEKGAYLAGDFIGSGMVSADPYKDARANLIMLENHMKTLTSIHAEAGLDFEEVIAQRAYEIKAETEAGLMGLPAEPGEVSTQRKDTADVSQETAKEDKQPAPRQTPTLPKRGNNR